MPTGSGDPWPDSGGGWGLGRLPGLPSTSKYAPVQLAVARWSACSRTCPFWIVLDRKVTRPGGADRRLTSRYCGFRNAFETGQCRRSGPEADAFRRQAGLGAVEQAHSIPFGGHQPGPLQLPQLSASSPMTSCATRRQPWIRRICVVARALAALRHCAHLILEAYTPRPPCVSAAMRIRS